MSKIDRSKTCPFLIRVFISSTGFHHNLNQFTTTTQPQNELSFYTWKDSTIRELLTLTTDANPNFRLITPSSSLSLQQPSPKYSIKLIYFNTSTHQFISRDIAIINQSQLLSTTTTTNNNNNSILDKTLDNIRFIPGDFLDIAYITTNNNNARNDGPSQSFNNSNSNRGGFSIRGGGGGGGGSMQGGRYQNVNNDRQEGNYGRRDNRLDLDNRRGGAGGGDSFRTNTSTPVGGAKDLDRWSKRSEQPSRVGRSDNDNRTRRRSSRSISPDANRKGKAVPPHLTARGDDKVNAAGKDDKMDEGDLW